MITNDSKAKIIQLSMDIDLGIIDLTEALNVIRADIETWVPILDFMENCCELTQNALHKLYLESIYLRS